MARIVFLAGDRIYLRPLDRLDAEIIQPWANDSDVTRNLTLYRPLSLEAEERFIEQFGRSDADAVFGIVEAATDTLIGVTGLNGIDWRNRHAAFGIFLGDKSKWGLGYGTEATALVATHAFETLNLNRLWLHVRVDNVAGITAYEKVGFRREGILKQHLYRENRYHDIVAMALLHEDWRPDSTSFRAGRPDDGQRKV